VDDGFSATALANLLLSHAERVENRPHWHRRPLFHVQGYGYPSLTEFE
jgi:hypothetical protein